jgi:putative pyruvate formate lyase activating enzyme
MKPLERYDAVVGHRAFARYLLTGSVAVERFEHLSLPEMWQMHDEAMVEYRRSDEAASPQPRSLSLMGLKRQIALKLFTSCGFCEHDCRVDRRTRPGRCGVLEPRIASQFLHMSEEEALVPSYTVFFSGCNLQCAFCQNYDISTCPELGREVPAREMAARFDDVLRCGGKNINWVGGDPTPALHYALDVLLRARTNIAQIWNSNMYMSEKAMSLLDGSIDVYLADLKYGNDDCAYRLSGIRDYMRVMTRNHLLAGSQGEVIVRHLMLPGHLECCTIPVLDWLAGHMPNALVNIMAQYHPEHRALEFPELRGRVSRNDHRAAIEHARELGLKLI